MVKSRQKKNDIIKHLLHACKEMKTKNATQFQNVPSLSDGKWLVSERFKLMACKVYKVGSTNTARILYALDHMSENTDSHKVKGSRARHNSLLEKINNSKENMESQFSSYKKFLFIRQPLERLMSAYRDRRPRSWFRQNK